MKPATAKGAGGRGEALRFAAPPQGEQGVIKSTHHSAESEDSGRPPHCRRPLPKVFQKSSIFEPQFQHAFLHAKYAKTVKMDPNKDPLWRPKSAKIEQKVRLESNMKNTFKK